MNKREALVSLNLVLDIGSIRLRRLMEAFGAAENILKASRQQLIAVSGIGDKIAQKITGLREDDLAKELRLTKKLGLTIVTIDDADYPENLRSIIDPPIVLYVKGKISKDDRLSVAIVGSRSASFYGISCAEKFAFALAQNNITVVSGMARGVDTAAHRGALKQGGRTIAVIGSGFGNIYPEENMGLAEEIACAGAVISEFPVDTPPLKQNFPRRNRVISGLSQGVLVVEAARNSGALITADFALEQSREVFALPGKVDAENSFGTNDLIKQGAKLVTGIDDILEELDFAPAQNKEKTEVAQRPKAAGVAEEEELVYASVETAALTLDELVQKTELDIPRISVILLRLQLRKLIKELPGKQYKRNTA